MTGDLPQMVNMASTVAQYTSDNIGGLVIGTATPLYPYYNPTEQYERRIFTPAQDFTITPTPNNKDSDMTCDRRVVKVYIADPDENVPIEDCLLYEGEERLTDLTDEELFFEIDIKGILDEHNKKRAKLFDKSVKERKEHLEKARIRDLKMAVVTVAAF